MHGYTQHRDEHGTAFAIQPYQRYPHWMLRYNLGFIFHCSLLVRREKLLRDALFFDESLRYVGDADWLIRLYQQQYRFCRIERNIGAYRHHMEQVTVTATQDQRANAARLEERARVFRKYRSGAALRRAVASYDTLHQRRVKVLGAWRQGGAAQVLKVTFDWMGRVRSGH